jgi:hypothetical protein
VFVKEGSDNYDGGTETGSTTTTYVVDSLTNGTVYSFKVQAINIDGLGEDSNEDSITPVDSDDATLRALTYNVASGGVIPVSDFTAETLVYNVELPFGTSETAVIAVTGEPTDTNANITADAGVTLTDGEGTATVTVTAEDASTTQDYIVNFTIAPPTDAEKLAVDKGLIEVGTYVIPLASQTDQTAKTAWVQDAVDDLTEYGTVAVVTYNNLNYEVALTLNEEEDTAVITVTEAPGAAVGAQVGTLIAGSAGSVTYPVTTTNIADGTYTVVVATLPANVSIGTSGQVTIADGEGTLTLEGTSSIVAGTTADLKLTIEGAESAAFSLLILAPRTLTNAEADGEAGERTSTEIALTFDEPVYGLTAANVEVEDDTGAVTAGAITGSGKNWRIALDDVDSEGDVTVTLTNFGGYAFTSSNNPATVAVYRLPSADATLRTLTYDADSAGAVDVLGFAAATETYNVELPYGTADDAVIVIAGMTTESHAAITTNAGATLSAGTGAATVEVTAEDGATTKTYTINFTIAEPVLEDLLTGGSVDISAGDLTGVTATRRGDAGASVTNVAVLVSDFTVPSGYSIVVFSGGTQAGITAIVRTGMEIRLLDTLSQDVLDTATVIVTGDLLGTGYAEITGFALVAQYLLDPVGSPLSPNALAAGDFDGGGVGITDFALFAQLLIA